MSRAAAILAARSVATHLAQPAPELLNAIAAVKGCGLLTQSLPLADASPFGGLPDATEETGGGFAAAVPAARVDLPRPRVAAVGQPVPAAEQKPGGGAQAPVFSFRRSGAAPVGTAASPAGTNGVREDTASTRERVATELPAIERRETAAASSAAPVVRPVGARITPTSEVRRPDQAAQAIELLDALATELLAAPVLEPPALHTGAPPDARAAARGAAPVFEQVRGESPSTVLSEFTSAPPAETRVVSHLRMDHRSLTVAARNEQPGAGSASASADIHLVPNQYPAVPEASAPSHLDAETLASMVNEVLAEQARRHGVDLS